MIPFTTTITRPFLPLAIALVALGQTSNGQTITLAEWNDYALDNANPADIVAAGTSASDFTYTGTRTTQGTGGKWLIDLDPNDAESAGFQITADGGPLRIDQLSFFYEYDGAGF